MKASRPLLVVGVSDPQVVDSFAISAKEAGAELEVAADAEEAQAWLDDRDPVAIAVDMTFEGAEAACLGIRGIARLAHVPVIGVAPELNDLVFPEIYGWGGDDVIRMSTPTDIIARLRGLANDASLHPPPAKGGAVVLDHDPRRRGLYARVLRNAGYEVRFAIEPDEAVSAVGAGGVKLVIADAEIGSEEGGADFAKRIRTEWSDLPVVLVSAPKKMASHRAAAAEIPKLAVTDGFAPPENLLFVANELGRSGANDGRASARLLYGTVVAFRIAGRDHDAFGCTYNISAGGLYVRSLAPLERGEDVWIELLPPRSDRRVRVEGKVVWRRRFGPIESATVPPGFGVQITDGAKGDLARYESGYRAFAADTVGA